MLFDTVCSISSFSASSDECIPYVNISQGELRTAVKLDREEIGDTLTCSVKLSGNVEEIHIEILDLNDNVPRFSELERVHIKNVTENFNAPNPIVRLHPEDEDKGANGTVELNITAGNEAGFFYIGPPLESEDSEDEKWLFFGRTVDREEHQIFNITIILCDKGTPPLCFEQIVIINIVNVNDEDPIFIVTEYSFDVNESHPLGPHYPFGNVTALDPDSTGNVYEFDGTPLPPEALEYIDINRETGELYLKKPIDFEVDHTLLKIELSIKVNERNRTHIDVARVRINVTDVNDERPKVTPDHRNPQNFPENENLLRYPILFRASDLDGSISDYDVYIQPPLEFVTTKFFSLYKIKINATLDREKVENVTVNFTAYDDGTPPLETTYTVHLMVLDENDNSPNFSQVAYHAIVSESTPLRKVAVTVEANDPDFAENGSVSYAITSVNPTTAQPWFDIDTLTGDIMINASLNYSDAESVSIVVTASDNGTYQLSTSTTVTLSISPAVTFKPRSYQKHCSPSTKIQETSKIYLEFRTDRKTGLLLYEKTQQDDLFVLGIEDNKLMVTTQIINDVYEIDTSTNKWISVLYDSNEVSLNNIFLHADV